VRRRDFIKAIIVSAAAWPLPSGAQQAAKVYRIGYLGSASHAGYAREIEALLKGLRQLGYEEEKNIAIHYRFAEGDYDRLPALAAQRAILAPTPAGNVLWDCLALIDNATVDVLTGLGGVAAIAISHPHYYTTMGVEPRARGSADPSECG
jgi:hypothetical protein